jgi:transposase
MALFWLSDEAWSSIEPHLPSNQPGARRVDDRRVISGILHVLKVGCRWCDFPTEYGPSTTIYNRFNRWSRRGFWLKLLDALIDAGAVTRSIATGSTYIKAQRSAFGGKGGARIRRSGARAVVRWLDHQDPRAYRCHRTSLRADADARQHK